MHFCFMHMIMQMAMIIDAKLRCVMVESTCEKFYLILGNVHNF